MKVTMLYFDTIGETIKKHGFSWEDVGNIKDHHERFKYGVNKEFSCTLEHAFYFTHMGGFNENSDHGTALIKAFLEALQEAKARRINQLIDGQIALNDIIGAVIGA